MSEVKDSMHLLNIFQDFYTVTGRLLTSNGLLVMPDGDAPPGENKVNIKQLYDLFKNTDSHGIVSLPFLGLLLHYFEGSDMRQVKNATSELYKNLSYMSLSGARQFEFEAVSDLIAQLSILFKKSTLENQKMREIESEVLAKKIIDDQIFKPTIQDPLDDVIEIIEEPDPKHKKTMFPYLEPTVQQPDEIEDYEQVIIDNFIDLQNEFDKVNNAATEQKKQKEMDDLVGSIIEDTIPNNDFWWEEDVFNKSDPPSTVNATKIIVDDIKDTTKDAPKNIDIQALSGNILKNIWPVDNRTDQQLANDQFISIDNRRQQELEDDNFLSVSEESEIEEIDTTSAWDQNKTEVAKPGPVIKLSTDYDKKVKAAKKIKNKYIKKTIGQRNTSNKISVDWLKNAGYLDTKDQKR